MTTFSSVRSPEMVVSSRVGVLCSETGAGGFPVLNETMKGCSVMRSIKSVLVALVAVLALGAVAASGASAHEYFIEGKSMKELGLKEEAVSGKATSSVARITWYGGSAAIGCKSNTVSGTIKEGGEGTTTFSLTGCTVERPGGCKVQEPIVLETNSGLTEGAGGLEDEFVLSSPSLLRFKGCLLGEQEMEGHFGGLLTSKAKSGTDELSVNSGLDEGLISLVFKVGVTLSGANAGKEWSAA